MRFFILLGLIGLLLMSSGCHDGVGSADLTFNIVNGLTGAPVVGAEVRLVTDGVAGPEFENVDSNVITIPNVPPGNDYSVVVPTPIGTAPVWFGPFSLAGSDRTFDIEVLTYQQLLDTYGVAQPTNGTVTLVAFGYDRFGPNATPLEVQVDVDNGAFTGTGTPAVVTGIPFPPATHDVTVTATQSGKTVTFPGMLFLGGNSVQVARVSFAEAQ
jgi:hypothetical protein